MVTDEFYRLTEDANVSRATVPREKAIRLYCTQHAATWSLQVRAPQALSNGQDGKIFMIADARLSRDDLIALRDAIDGFLEDE